jgi:hypothetical protein
VGKAARAGVVAVADRNPGRVEDWYAGAIIDGIDIVIGDVAVAAPQQEALDMPGEEADPLSAQSTFDDVVRHIETRLGGPVDDAEPGRLAVAVHDSVVALPPERLEVAITVVGAVTSVAEGGERTTAVADAARAAVDEVATLNPGAVPDWYRDAVVQGIGIVAGEEEAAAPVASAPEAATPEALPLPEIDAAASPAAKPPALTVASFDEAIAAVGKILGGPLDGATAEALAAAVRGVTVSLRADRLEDAITIVGAVTAAVDDPATVAAVAAAAEAGVSTLAEAHPDRIDERYRVAVVEGIRIVAGEPAETVAQAAPETELPALVTEPLLQQPQVAEAIPPVVTDEGGETAEVADPAMAAAPPPATEAPPDTAVDAFEQIALAEPPEDFARQDSGLPLPPTLPEGREELAARAVAAARAAAPLPEEQIEIPEGSQVAALGGAGALGALRTFDGVIDTVQATLGKPMASATTAEVSGAVRRIVEGLPPGELSMAASVVGAISSVSPDPAMVDDIAIAARDGVLEVAAANPTVIEAWYLEAVLKAILIAAGQTTADVLPVADIDGAAARAFQGDLDRQDDDGGS